MSKQPLVPGWERVEHVLEDLVPLLRKDLMRRFPGMPEETLRDCVKEVLSDVLVDDNGMTEPQQVLDRICARVVQAMS